MNNPAVTAVFKTGNYAVAGGPRSFENTLVLSYSGVQEGRRY